MGIYFRKSFGRGPVRLNLSKSGLGVSAGVKGARLSVGPRGTYVHMGRNGVYYRQRLDAPAPGGRSPARAPGALPHAPVYNVPMEAVQTAGVDELVESSSADLLPTINTRIAKFPFAWLVGVPTLFAAYGVGCLMEQWAMADAAGVAGFASLILGMIGTGLVAGRDRARRSTPLVYDFEPEEAQRFAALQATWMILARCRKIWRVTARQHHGDWKYNAGATQSVNRQEVTLSRPDAVHRDEYSRRLLERGRPALLLLPQPGPHLPEGPVRRRGLRRPGYAT
jgi:hypothetical protein